jgi:protein SCO1
MNRNILIFVTGILLGLLLVLGSAWFVLNRNYTYQGVLIDPPAPAADFTLTDQSGSPFQLSGQKGKAVMIFFGYTHCADVCPITLAQYTNIKRMLGDKAKDVSFVFITVDPERDNAQVMQEYLSKFDSSFIGLTGDQAVLESVWKAYGVYQAQQGHAIDMDYLVDHSARIYVIDPQGNWRINFPYGMDNEKITQDLLHLLSTQS